MIRSFPKFGVTLDVIDRVTPKQDNDIVMKSEAVKLLRTCKGMSRPWFNTGKEERDSPESDKQSGPTGYNTGWKQ